MHVLGTESEYVISLHSHTAGRELTRDVLEGILDSRHIPWPVVESDSTNPLVHYLSNGDKWYKEALNVCILEYATHETLSPRTAMLAEMRGIEFIGRVCASYNETQPPNYKVMRRTRDMSGYTAGYHINMCIPADMEQVRRNFSPLLLTMAGGMALFGAGCIADTSRSEGEGGAFRVFQKGDQINRYFHDQTNDRSGKPFIAIRDEPWADRTKYQRLHIVGQDVLHSPWATWLRLGMYERDVTICEQRPDLAQKMRDYLPAKPGEALRAMSADPTFRTTITAMNGKHYSAVDLLEIGNEKAQNCIDDGDIPTSSAADRERLVVQDEAIWAVDCLRNNLGRLTRLSDGQLRKALLERYSDVETLTLKGLDLGADVIAGRNHKEPKFQRVLKDAGYQRIAECFGDVTAEELARQGSDINWVSQDTRAGHRGATIEEAKLRGEIVRADWDHWHTSCMSCSAPAPQNPQPNITHFRPAA